MVFKRLLISGTGDYSALHVHCLGVQGDIALNQYNSLLERGSWKGYSYGERAFGWYNNFTQNMFLKRLFTGHAVKPLHIHCLGLPAGQASSWHDSFTMKMVLKAAFINDTGKFHHVHCSGLTGDRHNILLKRWSWKGHSIGREKFELI